MKTTSSVLMAAQLMEDFAGQTGLLPNGSVPPRRYLWTDAFGVCNYLALNQSTGDKQYLDLALHLVGQVHSILARHRDDDSRNGWISGLMEQEGRMHPTAGGLRIGKKMAERRPEDPYDDHLEWDRDGQYYHYLTKWIHALCRVGTVTGKKIYTIWSAELARRVHSGFCYATGAGQKRLRWKMSIDLSRPQVPSMGHHDPLDGLISFFEIQALAGRDPEASPMRLDAEIIDLADMCKGVNWATTDPLGLGGLLADAWRLAQLLRLREPAPLPNLLSEMLEASLIGLSVFTQDNILQLPSAYRLAFRELGLAIGLQAIPRIKSLLSSSPDIFSNISRLAGLLEALKQYVPLHEQIVPFWLKEENRGAASWTDHSDINTVMLATSLVPDGYLNF